MFSADIYVQVLENHVRARNVASGHVAERRSGQGFSHPRALVGNFTEAEATIRAAVSEVKGSGFLRSTRILIHPMVKCEGGLTQIESRVFRELAVGAGAGKVVVWVGESLNDNAVLAQLQKG